MTSPTTPEHASRSAGKGRIVLGGLSGLLAGAAAVGASEALSAVLSGVTSPLLAVGNRAVDTTPRPLKEWAIETFGDSDKVVLIGGVVATVALLAIVAGALGVRRPRLAVGIFLGLTVVAGAAVVTDRAATAGPVLRLLPVLALLVVGLVSLIGLLAALRRPATGDTDTGTAPAERATQPPEAKSGAVETLDSGKPRMLLPRRVDGDDLPPAFDRRAFLVAAVAVSAVAAAGGLISRQFGGAEAVAARNALNLPGASDKVPPVPRRSELGVKGITPYLTPNEDFYRVDTALTVPDVPIEGYQLRIHGMVDEELVLSFDDLLEMPLVERRITMTCVSNPVGGPYVGNATWLGVRVADLLERAGVQSGADAVKSTSVDDMTIGTPLEALTDDRDALIAIGMNGEPLPLEHGFPVRMVTPGIYGYVGSTKWLVDLEVTRFADFEAYWTPRGYAAEAPIKTSARIDVPRSFAQLPAGKATVAGVAWSQRRGIAKVEVRIDGEDWQEAQLAAEDNIDTWRQWVYEWDATPGLHKVTVRATDQDGETQTEEREPIAPDGSTGWHNVDVTVQE